MGFFTPQQTKSRSRPDGKVYSCASCGLYQHVLSPRMAAYGSFEKGILNIGEGPGEDEDRRGRQWQGKMGRVLQRAYRRLGVDLFKDCLNINAVNCRPVDNKGSNRAPTSYEIACCRQRIVKIIEQYKPNVIVLHGGSAVQALIGHRWKKGLGGITKWRGWRIPDRDFGAWLCPVFHPSYVERNEGEEEVEKIWMDDLEAALAMADVPQPVHPDESKQVTLVDDKFEVEGELKKLDMGTWWPDANIVAWDIETTGLKPYDKKRHKVACMGFCESPGRAYVFPAPRRKTQVKNLQALLQNRGIGKVAANMKFEELWMQIKYGFGVAPWIWDTMQAAHVLDNRPGVTSLKFQTYVNFGVVDYDSEISGYLEADPKNANSVNRVMELMESRAYREKLMTYCGMDCLFTYKLALMQMEQMGVDPQRLVEWYK